jgi:hypothetical protein
MFIGFVSIPSTKVTINCMDINAKKMENNEINTKLILKFAIWRVFKNLNYLIQENKTSVLQFINYD